MTIQTETVRVAVSPVIACKGRGKAQREVAFMQVAALSMIDTLGRADLIANLRVALGNAPTDVEVQTAQRETTIGRVAARLPASEFPKDCTTDDAKLDHARQLVMSYQAPLKPGVKSKLRKGMLGYRSETQHKAIRAADEAWSQLKAELGLGNAQTQAQRNAAKKAPGAPSMAGSGKGAKSKGAATPTHSELVTPAKPLTADEAAAFVTSQAATLLAYANKHAKLLPTPFGAAIQAFKSAINTAANDYAVAKAARDAVKADNAK